MNFLGDDSDGCINFKINKDYAKSYDVWRRKELTEQLKNKYGSDDGESSTSEEEDENAVELTDDLEKQFYKTLSYLKEKNPLIYDNSVRFFEPKSNEPLQKVQEKKKNEPISIAKYQRNLLLKGASAFESEDKEEKPSMTNVEEEEAIKRSFKDVLQKFDDDEDDDDAEQNNEIDKWGGVFKKRVKTKEEIQKEEDDYREWLAGEKEKMENNEAERDLKGLHDYWSDPKLSEGEQFLRDYVLKKRFLQEDDSKKVPSYDEIVHDSDSGLSADEDTLAQQDDFERKYNFRFEEPDPEFIKRHPRIIEGSMRKKDDRRKVHREEVKKRKEAEKNKKAEELKTLKSLKKMEIMEKIKKLKEITGNDDIGFGKDDLEKDFDPNEYDKRMSELFNDDYYVVDEEEKPELPEIDEELEIENWDDWGGETRNQDDDLHCEDPGFNMDCDYDPQQHKVFQKELVESSKSRKGKRRQSKFAAAVAKKKPLFNPKDKSFEKYVDEYYSLDYEDLIGDIPCRFKYRKVVPNDFGLSVEEILSAPDSELNSWASIKKIMQRRPEHKELYDVKAYGKKAKDIEKKKKCLPSVYGVENDESEQNDFTANNNSLVQKEKNEKGESLNEGKSKKRKAARLLNEEAEDSNNHSTEFSPKKKKKKKEKPENQFQDKQQNQKKNKNKFQSSFEDHGKKKYFKEKPQDSNNEYANISDARLKSYGLNPKKFRNKMKYSKKGTNEFVNKKHKARQH